MGRRNQQKITGTRNGVVVAFNKAGGDILYHAGHTDVGRVLNRRYDTKMFSIEWLYTLAAITEKETITAGVTVTRVREVWTSEGEDVVAPTNKLQKPNAATKSEVTVTETKKQRKFDVF